MILLPANKFSEFAWVIANPIIEIGQTQLVIFVSFEACRHSICRRNISLHITDTLRKFIAFSIRELH